MRVSIIIPNYNGKGLLEKNLPSILTAKKNRKNYIEEIIIVDDGSSDESVQFLKRKYKKQIRLVVHKKNRGFSATVNTGARTARCELLCLLNSDVEVTKDFLEFVIPHFKDDKVFAVSLHERGYGPALGKFEQGFIGHSGGAEKKTAQDTFWVSGGSGVFRRDLWMKLGGMNEKLYSPYYWEDVDLGYMALKRGYKLLWEPRAMIIHEHEGSINATQKRSYKSRIQERNHLLFNWKNLTSNNLRKKHWSELFRRVSQHPGYLRVVAMAILKHPDAVKANRRERRESTVSDEAIFAKFN